MPSATIRQAVANDAGSIADLHRKLFNPPWDETSVGALMAPPTGLALVARSTPPSSQRDPQSHEIAGFVLARVAAGEAEILSIAVAPGLQGRGLGRQLVEQAIRDLHARGARRLFLEVAADNAPALALYTKLGLVEIGRRRGYYDRPGIVAADALLLACDL